MKKQIILLVILLGLSLMLATCGTQPQQAAAPDEVAAPTEAAAAATEARVATEPAADAPVTLTYLVDDSQNSLDTAGALVDAYMALHPNVTITIENRPQGGDGDNVVKTRLATGDMDDLFFYNSGSLLQALKPADTLVDISKEPFIANVVDSFLPTVSQNGQTFGVPTGTALGGGILYNKKI